METYGLLIKGLKLKHQGSLVTVLTPVVDFLLKFMIAIGVTRLTNSPVGVIFLVNFVILVNFQFMVHY